jgi:hypothetical protein
MVLPIFISVSLAHRIVFLLRIRRGRGDGRGWGKCRKRNKASDTSRHRSLPFNLFCSSLASPRRLASIRLFGGVNGIVARRQL